MSQTTNELPAPVETVVGGQLNLRCTVDGCYTNITYGDGFEGPEGLEKAHRAFKRHWTNTAPAAPPTCGRR